MFFPDTSWLGTKEIISNTTKASNTVVKWIKWSKLIQETYKMLNLNKCIKMKSMPKPTCRFKNCVCIIVHNCHTQSIHHQTVLSIFLHNLQTIKCCLLDGRGKSLSVTINDIVGCNQSVINAFQKWVCSSDELRQTVIYYNCYNLQLRVYITSN